MKKIIILIITVILITTLSVPAFATDLSVTSDDKSTALVSPALSIIAANNNMAKAGLVGNPLVFTHDDFRRALNLSRVDSITVTSLPDTACGRLLLGTTAVSIGQSVSSANLDVLVFSPANELPCQTEFTFTVGNGGYELNCSVFMLNSLNSAPVAARAAGVSLTVDTHTDTAAFGKLSATDPEGDSLRYVIIDYPSHGLLVMNDATSGEYTYLPSGKFSGKDSFRYVARDIYGNYSASATVSLTVTKSSTNIVYSDMNGEPANNAALTLTEKGIMSGNQQETVWYFNPDGSVTRSEFLVMAMQSAGFYDLPASESSVFFDDTSIQDSAKPYTAAALELGYISGTTDSNGNLCFMPDEEITRAEAALMVDKIISGSDLLGTPGIKPVFDDSKDVPTWAEASVINLNLLGMLDDENGKIDATGKLSRSDAAIMLAAILKIR